MVWGSFQFKESHTPSETSGPMTQLEPEYVALEHTSPATVEPFRVYQMHTEMIR